MYNYLVEIILNKFIDGRVEITWKCVIRPVAYAVRMACALTHAMRGMRGDLEWHARCFGVACAVFWSGMRGVLGVACAVF